MDTNTLVIGWNRAVVGREAVAGELFGNMVAFLDKQQKAGKIQSWEPCFLEVHGGDFNGFWYVKGTHANLTALRTSDEFTDLMMRAIHCIENIGAISGWSGMQAGQELMGRWAKQAPR